MQADAKDCSGLTPLHLAAIAPDDSLAEKVLQACTCSPSTWFTAAANDGLTPAHFAARLGRHCLNARILLLAQAKKVQHAPPPTLSMTGCFEMGCLIVCGPIMRADFPNACFIFAGDLSGQEGRRLWLHMR